MSRTVTDASPGMAPARRAEKKNLKKTRNDRTLSYVCAESFAALSNASQKDSHSLRNVPPDDLSPDVSAAKGKLN